MPWAQVFKTLVAPAGAGPVFAVVPAGSELDLKALAAAPERKSATWSRSPTWSGSPDTGVAR